MVSYAVKEDEIMQIPSSVIYRLLLGEHISIQERRKFGITPLTRIRLSDLVQFLAKEITKAKRFPPETEDNLCPTYEGIIITQVSESRFICISKRTLADNPNVIAEQAENSFTDTKDAANFFLKWELCLPGRLDGIIVE